MIYIPISPAELLDKITILEIKADRISTPEKLEHVRFELTSLIEIYDRHMPESGQVRTWKAQLKRLNESLWSLEDDIRNSRPIAGVPRPLRGSGTTYLPDE